MKVVVVGGTGLIGASLVTALRRRGLGVVAASPATGVNAVTGEGLGEALDSAEVLIDVTNAPSFEARAARAFFVGSTRNLLIGAGAAGVRHYVALSVVGADRLVESGYYRAKRAQESLIRCSGVPYTLVRSTQFFEFIDQIIRTNTEGDAVRLAPALVQPVAADDVVAVLADVATGPPLNATIEVAGPEAIALAEVAREVLSAHEIPRRIIVDVHARYFGAELTDHSLMAGPRPRIGPTRISEWLRQSIPPG